MIASNLYSETTLLCDLGKKKTKVDYLLSKNFKFTEKQVKKSKYSPYDYGFDYYILKLVNENSDESKKRIIEEHFVYNLTPLSEAHDYVIRTSEYYRPIDIRPNNSNIPYGEYSWSMGTWYYLAYSKFKSLDRETLSFRDVSQTQTFTDYDYAYESDFVKDSVSWSGRNNRYKCQIVDGSKEAAFREKFESIQKTLSTVEEREKIKEKAKEEKEIREKEARNKI